jgi:hypothetical protein
MTTYWYFCSQRDDLAAKSRKHQDISKHRDAKAMERFRCNGVIKVSVDKLNNMASLSVKHEFLHKRPINVDVSQDIKDFIKKHIDLLPREIYAQLVSKGLDPSIRQKQIHFWWSKLGQNRYKRNDDAFKSTIEWLKEKNYNIILEETIPVHAIAFTTGLYEKLNQVNVKIRECGIDATCKYYICYFYKFCVN